MENAKIFVRPKIAGMNGPHHLRHFLFRSVESTNPVRFSPRATRWTALVTVRAYTREERLCWAGRHGWYATCGTCGEEVSGSIAGLALAQPEVQAVRRSEPAMRMLPVRDVVRDDQPAKVVGFSGSGDREVASVVFLRDSLRLPFRWDDNRLLNNSLLLLLPEQCELSSTE